MIVVDTSFVLALLNEADVNHALAASWDAEQRAHLVTTPFVIAELDHLLARPGGASGRAALRRDLHAGMYRVEWWPTAISEAAEIAEVYWDVNLGLGDASLIALAGRLDTIEIATFDEELFRAVQPLKGGDAFTVLPIDA